jgi:phosphoglycolate phosphatase-like HAD superfamily hydrolase
VNASVEKIVRGVPPFPCVRECLQELQGRADLLVVSATPSDALHREWQEHNLTGFVHSICGQEAGTKQEMLSLGKKYGPDHTLMVGDAPGDYSAAQANRTLFFPIVPGREDGSWQRFFQEGIDRFFAGTFAGQFQDQLLEEFDRGLPAEPPWQTAGS